jgi:methyl-accepting chemotaxis protein
MEFIANILLIAGALAAAVYCIVLARRLRRFNDLEAGVGGAIATLSTHVEDMTKTLAAARKASAGSAETLRELTDRAEAVARRLELLVASMHDIPEATATTASRNGMPPAQQAAPESATENAASGSSPPGDPLFLSSRRKMQEAAE